VGNSIACRLRPGLFFFPVLIFFQGGILLALDSFPTTLDAEIWTEREILSWDEAADETTTFAVPITSLNPDMRTQLLKEAQFVLSGMIFGFSFVYVPLDRERNVAEYFSLKPIAQFPWGDDSLDIRETRVENGRLLCRFSYDLKDYQKDWVNLWRSNDFPSAGALGTGSVFNGTAGKYEAMENAVKEAVRAYARERVHNKPKRIEGEVVFSEPPRMYLDAGNYTAKVRVKLNIKKMTGYMRY